MCVAGQSARAALHAPRHQVVPGARGPSGRLAAPSAPGRGGGRGPLAAVSAPAHVAVAHRAGDRGRTAVAASIQRPNESLHLTEARGSPRRQPGSSPAPPQVNSSVRPQHRSSTAHVWMSDFRALGRLPWRERVAFGVRGGARLGAYFALLTGVADAFTQRGSPGGPAPIPMAAAMFAGMVIGGGLFGAGRPWVRDSYGAALLGAACLAPTVGASAFAAGGARALDVRVLLGVGAAAFLLGSMLGVMAWRGWTRQP